MYRFLFICNSTFFKVKQIRISTWGGKRTYSFNPRSAGLTGMFVLIALSVWLQTDFIVASSDIMPWEMAFAMWPVANCNFNYDQFSTLYFHCGGMQFQEWCYYIGQTFAFHDRRSMTVSLISLYPSSILHQT